jgi:transcriptional regulator
MGTPELIPGTLEALILRTVAAEGPLHGYGIAGAIGKTSGNVLIVEEGSLYPALQRLLRKGDLVAEWGQSENNRRARFYRLTAAGRQRLEQEIPELERVVSAIFRVLRPAEGG